MTKKLAVIIIPTYNERENIRKLIPILDHVVTKVNTWTIKVLVVDDKSPDGTGHEVADLQKKYQFLELLENPKKNGLGGAYLKGMAKAFLELKADAVFEMDADLSHDPNKIPEMISKLDEGYDMVLGSRYIPGGGIPSNWGFHRKLLSVVGNLLIMIFLTDFRIRDWTGGYRAISKQVYDAVSPFLTGQRFSGYTFQIGFLHQAVKHNFKIIEIPFIFVDREIGESKLGMEYIKNTILYIFKARLTDLLGNRLFKFVLVGGFGALIQLTFLTLFRKFTFFELANFLAIEVAIISNFVLSNFWTFADRKLPLLAYPGKFLTFNLTSTGSIIIQQVVVGVGNLLFGLVPIFSLPVIGLTIDTGIMYAVIGIFIGMFWNFFAYSKIIWKKSK